MIYTIHTIKHFSLNENETFVIKGTERVEKVFTRGDLRLLLVPSRLTGVC